MEERVAGGVPVPVGVGLEAVEVHHQYRQPWAACPTLLSDLLDDPREVALEGAVIAKPREGIGLGALADGMVLIGVSQRDLGTIIGVSESTVSRIKTGDFPLDRDPKAFELSLLFVRLYRSRDAIVGGDRQAAASWLRSFNTALDARPIDAIQSITGLVNVIGYLDSRRAPI